MSIWKINNDILNGYPYIMLDYIKDATWENMDESNVISDSISTIIGKTVIAIATTRSETIFSDGWDLIANIDCSSSTSNQYLYILQKVAENEFESITITQTDDTLMYLQLISFNRLILLTKLWEYATDSIDVLFSSIEIPDKLPKDTILWVMSSVLWSDEVPLPKWTTFPDDIARYSSLDMVTKDRQSVFFDNGNGVSNRNFSAGIDFATGFGLLQFKIDVLDKNEDMDYSIIGNNFSFNKSFDLLSWKHSDYILDGYPYVKSPYLNIPQVIMSLTSNINRDFDYINFVQNTGDLIVTISETKYILKNDFLTFTFTNKDSPIDVLHTDTYNFTEEGYLTDLNVDFIIPLALLKTLSLGYYDISLSIISKDTVVFTKNISYDIREYSILFINKIMPNKLTKPIDDGQSIDIFYTAQLINNVDNITNTFKISNFVKTVDLYTKKLEIRADIDKTDNIKNGDFVFDVIFDNFKLISFKFYFAKYSNNSTSQIEYKLDDTILQSNIYNMDDWIECIPSTPILLDKGRHTISISGSNDWQFYESSTYKVNNWGLIIVSNRAYRMEMIYTTAMPNMQIDDKITINIDNTILPGHYPIIVDSLVTLESSVNEFSKKIDDIINIVDIIDKDIPIIGVISTNIKTIFREKKPKRYGVSYDVNDSNPVLTRLYGSVGLKANVATSLEEEVHNDFDNIYPFNEIKEEMIIDREMIKIPKFYIRRELIDDVMEIVICEKKYDDSYVPHEMFLKGNIQWTGNHSEDDYNDYIYIAKYQSPSTGAQSLRERVRDDIRKIHPGWSMLDIATWDGLQKLFLIVFATRNSRDIMIGNQSSSTNRGLTVGARSTCVQITNRAMSFYGIENLYGNYMNVIDGIVRDDNNIYYISTDISNYRDDSENYIELSYSIPRLGGYIKKLGFDKNNKFVMLPIEVGGSSTTYFTNYNSSTATTGTGWRSVIVGGGNTNQLSETGFFYCGVFFVRGGVASSGITVRAMYRPFK